MVLGRMVFEPPRKGRGPARFSELTVVALTRALIAGGRPLPKGSLGTVVAAYKDGLAYEVEFEHPFHAVLTVEADDLPV